VGGLPELIEDGVTGALFPVGDTDALASHLCRLLTDREEARRMGQAARERAVSRFSVSRMAREYHDAALAIIRDRAAIDLRPQRPLAREAAR
jgi:glycosyltransferase involved in cell wall biosynthesis